MINILSFIYMDKIQLKEIQNCYNNETYLELDKNLEIFTIFLISTNNINCKVFPTDVYVNITLSTPLNQKFQIQLQNFSYLFTTKIVIFLDQDILQGSTLEDFAYSKFAHISIYSLSETTQFQVMSSHVKKSNLLECFSILALTLNPNNITLITYPRNGCKLQISNTNSESKLVLMSIVINDVQFDFNSVQLQHFIDRYQQSHYIESIIQTNISEIILQPFHTAKFKILSHQGTIDVAIEYPIKYIYVSSTNDYFQQSMARIFIQNNSFIPTISIDKSTDLQTIQQQINLITYTKVVKRLSCKLNKQLFSYQSIVYGYFNLSEQKLIISCNEGTQNQRQYCQQFYNHAYENTETECYLDILIYNGDVCNYIEKILLYTTFTCFEKFWLTKDKNNNICVDVQFKYNNQLCEQLFDSNSFYDNVLILVKFDQKLYQEHNSQYGMAKYIKKFDQSTMQFCFNCSDDQDQYISQLNEYLKCNTSKQYFKQKNYWILSLFNDQSISGTYVKTDYRLVTYIIVTIGILIFLISLVLCVLQIKQTRSIILEVKHRKVPRNKR
ncbi:Conserved_hypothetical protein [Hexamita inflata]|uniref:Transmembrane protein n=1 Tax=Hexamita inflata TaxID=28002 RepID=A0ABP1IU00_9EUKA